nr:MAG TPA: hypothetical protein [Caudoviricetes sp.]
MNETIVLIVCGWITLLVVVLPLAQHIEFLRDCKKYDRETAEEKRRRIDE